MKTLLLKKLNNIRGKRILVIGDIILDKYVYGSVDRISPEAPVPVVKIEKEEYKLGASANVAKNIVKMGGIPLLVGVIGKDKDADIIKKLLKENNISSNFLIENKRLKTILKERVIALNQQVVRIDYDSDNTYLRSGAQILNLLKNTSYHGVIIEDYNKGFLNASIMKKITDWCSKREIIAVADPHPTRDIGFYKDTYTITPNFSEAISLLHLKREIPIKQIIKKLHKRCKNEITLITRGSKGMLLYDGNYHFIPTRAKKVYDVTGAGDTVVAIFTMAIVSGFTPIEASQLANYGASYVVTQIGTTACTPKIMKEILESE